ncbi:MAG: hypothetical protein AAGG68_08845 [Bacteroidota bacterium]
MQFGIIDIEKGFDAEIGVESGLKYESQFFARNDLENKEDYQCQGVSFSPFLREVEDYPPAMRTIFKVTYKVF